MPRKTMTFRSIQAHPARYTDQLFELDNINGTDLLDHFEEWATTRPDDHFKDEAKRTYGTKPAVQRFKRFVLLTMKTGPYDAPGEEVINTKQHSTEYTNGDDDASTTQTRCGLLVPPGAKTALFFQEKQGNEYCGKRVLESYTSVAGDIPTGQTTAAGTPSRLALKDEQVVEVEAWIQNASLSSIKAVRYDYTTDLADTPLRGIEMRYESVLTPERGERWFPRPVWELIRERQLGAAAYLGLPDAEDVDELVVNIGDGTTSKTMIIGKERGPAIRLLLNDYGQPTLTDPKLIERIDEEANLFYQRHDLRYDYGWTRV